MFQGKRSQVEVKCIYFRDGGYCTCSKVRGWFFGLGRRHCVSFGSPFQEQCSYLKKPLRSKTAK